MTGRRRISWDNTSKVIVFLLVVAVGYLLVSGVNKTVDANRATDAKQTAEQQLNNVADPVLQACAAGGALADELRRLGGCKAAADAKQSIEPPPGPSPADIAAAVESYLARFPPPAGRPPTVDEITTAVASYLTSNPPQSGRAPTSEEIALAVANYLVTNPPANGKDAPPPSQQQIDDAVARYLAANPPPKGDRGEPGPTCPDGYELRDALITAPDGSQYQGKACVDPASSRPPTTSPTPPDPPLFPTVR